MERGGRSWRRKSGLPPPEKWDIIAVNKETEQKMGKREKKKGSAAGKIIWMFFFLLFLGIFCFSAYKLITIYLEYKAGTDEYEGLQRYAVTSSVKPVKKEKPEADEGQEAAAGEQEPAEEAYQPPQVDFASLQAINPDVVGWLDMEMLDISYPIVKGQDNDQYLHTTVEGNYNFSGSIFMDAGNKADFSDHHTIIYGHNMKNKSMFGRLKFITEEEAYKDSRYFWICTPENTYKYEVFSAYITGVEEDTYTLYQDGGAEFLSWIEKRAGRSAIPNEGMAYSQEDYVVTLSTCTSDDAHRYVVLGRRVEA